VISLSCSRARAQKTEMSAKLQTNVETLLNLEVMWHEAIDDALKSVTDAAQRATIQAAGARMVSSMKRRFVPEFSASSNITDDIKSASTAVVSVAPSSSSVAATNDPNRPLGNADAAGNIALANGALSRVSYCDQNTNTCCLSSWVSRGCSFGTRVGSRDVKRCKK
jgi:hypothetical protein